MSSFGFDLNLDGEDDPTFATSPDGARKPYTRHSPSGLNLFAADPAMFVLERIIGVRQPVGVPALRGRAIEDGVTAGLLHGVDVKACKEHALTVYDGLTALSADPRREQYRKTIPDMVYTALIELGQYGPPSSTQGLVEWQPDGLKMPICGYYDYAWEKLGILADLKTTEKMPSQIKVSHARQVALYAASDNIDARLIYVTPKKLQPYRLENIRRHREALAQIAQRVENFLALSDDPNFFLTITAPNLESFYWNSPPARQLAYEHWKI